MSSPFENYSTAAKAQMNFENQQGKEKLNHFTEEMVYDLIEDLKDIAASAVKVSPELITKIDQLEDQIEEEIR